MDTIVFSHCQTNGSHVDILYFADYDDNNVADDNDHDEDSSDVDDQIA